MITDIACVQRNQPVSVKVRLIVSVRFAARVAQSRIAQTVDMVPNKLIGQGERVDVDKGYVGEDSVIGQKRLAVRLRFTRVSVPTMKEYQHAESLLA